MTASDTIKGKAVDEISEDQLVAFIIEQATEAPKFPESFDSYVCTGDTLVETIDGYTFTATVLHDKDWHINSDDCHNIIQSDTGCNDEQYRALLAARKAWFNDEWFYGLITIEASYNGIILGLTESLGGIECNYPGSDNSYLTDVANELLQGCIELAKVERQRQLNQLSQ